AATDSAAISAAGAFALTTLANRLAEASLTSTGPVTSAGTLRVGSSSRVASSATADATKTVDPTGSTANFGLGVAVAIDNAHASNDAFLAGNVTLRAPSVTVETLAPQGSTFGATATSGAGGKKVGAAGAFALNLVDNRSEALVKSGSVVD